MVFEKSVLKTLFGEKREEAVGYWIKLHKEELILCSSRQILLIKYQAGEKLRNEVGDNLSVSPRYYNIQTIKSRRMK
jgi:hypothetical protein